MNDNLWHDCLICEKRCCDIDLTYPLFITPAEKLTHNKINTSHSCAYLNDCNLCEIHNTRPHDCRFFPFDLMKINGKLYWIVWKIPGCLIVEKNHSNFEKYILEHEEKLIPGFLDYISAYAEFRIEELKKKYEFEVIRELIIR